MFSGLNISWVSAMSFQYSKLILYIFYIVKQQLNQRLSRILANDANNCNCKQSWVYSRSSLNIKSWNIAVVLWSIMIVQCYMQLSLTSVSWSFCLVPESSVLSFLREASWDALFLFSSSFSLPISSSSDRTCVQKYNDLCFNKT